MAKLEFCNSSGDATASNNNELFIPPAFKLSDDPLNIEHCAVGLPSVEADAITDSTQFELTHDDRLCDEHFNSDGTPTVVKFDSDNTDKLSSDVTHTVDRLVISSIGDIDNADDDVEKTEPFCDDALLELGGSSTFAERSVEEVDSLASCLDEVGKYAYITTVAQSLFVLFAYNQWHRSFQEACVKELLKHLGLPEQMENTLMLVTRGSAVLETMDPFISMIEKQQYVLKNGKQVMLADLLEFCLKKGQYDARMRVLVKYLSTCLSIQSDALDEIENAIAKSFSEEQHESTQEELNDKKRKHRNILIKRVALISLATVGGGVVIGLTGGLAAPLIAAGAGAVIGGAGSAVLGSVAGVAIIGSLFGVAGAGLTGYKMNKRVGSLKEFEFEPLSCGQALHLTIAVSGWLSTSHPEFRSAWLGLRTSKEQYVLRYESECIKELGRVFETVFSIGVSAAIQETLKHTILSGLLAAVTWPAALVSVSGIIDNPWSVCTQRTVLAGKELAEVLLARHQGRRPVTLIGYSFGARVIFACLREMAQRKNCEGIVEDAILLGAPVTGDVSKWRALERVVSGRVVNGYCRSDWLLKFMYRAASVQLSVAGLSPVNWDHRLMHNVDLTQVVSGHLEYAKKVDAILKVIDDETKRRYTRPVALAHPVDGVSQLSDDA